MRQTETGRHTRNDNGLSICPSMCVCGVIYVLCVCIDRIREAELTEGFLLRAVRRLVEDAYRWV